MKTTPLLMLLSLYFFSGVSYSEGLKIGAKPFTENQILAVLTSVFLERNGQSNSMYFGSRQQVGPREELLSGEIDLYWDYVGTAFHIYLE